MVNFIVDSWFANDTLFCCIHIVEFNWFSIVAKLANAGYSELRGPNPGQVNVRVPETDISRGKTA